MIALVDPAFAQAAGEAGPGGPLVMLLQFLPFILVFVVFYVLLIRPQQKRQRELKQMIENLKKGDRVITSGGIRGDVVQINPDKDTTVLKVADNPVVKLEFSRQAVVGVESKEKS